MQLDARLRQHIEERGPLTVAAFMEAALYDPECGYYARAVQRSGRAGDFFTSVDVGPLFGELIAIQIAEMQAHLLSADGGDAWLLEAGAGNARLSRDILQALQRDHPARYQRIRLHLIETSPSARAAQLETLGSMGDRLRSSTDSLPESYEGVLLANELLDAMPVHQVVMREIGLREVYVDWREDGWILREDEPSTPRLQEYFDVLGVRLEPGWRTEVCLRAVDWVRDAMARMARGFAIFIDYGHEARELYSVTHSAGTLTSFFRHSSAGAEAARGPATAAWLANPGAQDLTAHVDFTSIRAAAEAAGARTLGFLDQMYFLVALASDRLESLDLRQRLAFKTLVVPGGLGTTMKVLILGKGVGAPRLVGCSGVMRVT